MKDKNPIDGSEVDDYTVEFECIADDSAKLAQELSKCPLGEKVMALLDRAEFLPEAKQMTEEDMKAEAAEEEKARVAREEELREEGRKEVRDKYVEYIKGKRKPKRSEEEESEDEGAHRSDHERDERSGPQGFLVPLGDGENPT
jgi:hypothetical protein